MPAALEELAATPEAPPMVATAELAEPYSFTHLMDPLRVANTFPDNNRASSPQLAGSAALADLEMPVAKERWGMVAQAQQELQAVTAPQVVPSRSKHNQ